MPLPQKTTDKILTAGKWAGAISGIIVLFSTLITGVVKLNTLIQKVESSAVAVEQLKAENEQIRREAHDELTHVVDALRDRAARDQEILTQLRIAVATLEERTRRLPSTSPLTSSGSDTGAALRRAEALQDRDPIQRLSGF